jgi:hypothetical protein
MQTKESEKSNLELPALRITETNAMSRRKHWMFLIVHWLLSASPLPAARAQETNNGKPKQAATSPMTTMVIHLWPYRARVRAMEAAGDQSWLWRHGDN